MDVFYIILQVKYLNLILVNNLVWPVKNILFSWLSVAHTCNPSYSGDRDQEDFDSKPAWGNSPKRPYLEKTHPTKKSLVEWLKV
jgi:hypothetical protein